MNSTPVLREKPIKGKNEYSAEMPLREQKPHSAFKGYAADVRVWALALLNAAILYYILELGNKNPLMNGFFYTPVNIFTVFSLMAAVYTVVRRWWISSLITGIPCTVLGIANYYTLLYRNQPISTQDIHNLGTSVDVLGSYKFTLNLYVVTIALLFGICVLVTLMLKHAEKNRKRGILTAVWHNFCLAAVCGAFIFSMYMGKNPIKPRNTFVWSWEETYYKYGFAASSIEVMQNSLNPVKMPDGYSDERAQSVAAAVNAAAQSGAKPDIILILNETFYDLRDLVDIKTDTEFMPFIDGSDNLIKGRAVVAGTGGGTNKSEYEFLTSNSFQLMPGITPFNYLDFHNANSIVGYLKEQGYSTWGAHCANPLNYSRGKVYPLLGFDKIMFKDDFKDAEQYGKRWYATDESVYKAMTEEYEKMGGSPRFMYMLTIQNHGGWDLNDEKEDIVHTLTDFGAYNDDINEYLSCIKKSDDAFRRLTEYFAAQSRPVIICMVGDHSPAFAQELISDSGIETTFKLRSTPYVVWSNFDTESTFPAETSIPYLVPNVLKSAGCDMSEYYEYMTELEKSVPVLTAFNVYKTSDGSIHQYTDKNKFSESVNGYFDLEYNNTGTKAKRADEIFSPRSAVKEADK